MKKKSQLIAAGRDFPLPTPMDILRYDFEVSPESLGYSDDTKITPMIADFLGQRFNMSAEFWMNLQDHYDQVVHGFIELTTRLYKKEII